jgi:hypothetical protein
VVLRRESANDPKRTQTCRNRIYFWLRLQTRTQRHRVIGVVRRSIVMIMLMLLATPAVADLRIPCLWSPFSGCSFTFVSPEYAARPVKPLDPQAALAAVNAFRAEWP